jgi:hypothetical protein
MRQAIKPARTRADKTHEFVCFYRGWQDFMEGKPNECPASWGLAEKDLFNRGWIAASLEAERFRGRPL